MAQFVVISLDCGQLALKNAVSVMSIFPLVFEAGPLLPLLQLFHGGTDLIGLLLQSMNHVVLLLHPVIGSLGNHSQHSIVVGLNE